MNMRRVIMMIVAAMMFSSQAAQAQSLNSFLRMLSGSTQESETEDKSEPAKTVKLTADMLRGTWTYSAPALKYEGDDMLATIALKGVESYLPSIYAKAGLSAGVGTLTFTRTREVHAAAGERKVSGTYSFSTRSSEIVISTKHDGESYSFCGTAQMEGDVLVLLFDASETADLIMKMSSEVAQNDTFKMMKSILDKYPGIKLGCKMKR